MADKKLIGGLKWVKGEIGATLRPVRELVEAGRIGDASADLAAATRALEQIHGVLLALQLSTPARLVEEMSRLVERMDGADPDQLKQAAEVMHQALAQLNGHLDRLDAGFDEPPLSLWSIINEVRSACDSLPLTHSELLTFAAVNADGDSQWMPEELDILAEVMRQVRPQFHRHLVEWFRGDPENQGILHLSRLFRQLHDYLKEGLLADLFLLCETFVEGLRDGRLTAGPQTRTLMGHLDWVLKPLVQKPPQWPEVDALTLIEQFLAALEGARISSPQILRLQASYGLGRSGSIQPSADSAGLDEETELAELAASTLGDFTELKEIFDRMAHGDQPDQGDLNAFCSTLQRLAGLLDEVEVGNLPARMRSLADKFAALQPGALNQDAERLESHAMELLGIEAVLLAYADHRDAEVDQLLAPDMDLSELTSATLREAGYEMLRVKDAIATWQSDPADLSPLESVGDYLFSVSGALRILGDNPAADRADALAGLIESRYVKHGQHPDETELDHLADVIAALELYIGHLQEPMPLGDELIERAARSLEALGALPEAEPQQPIDTREETSAAERVEPEFETQPEREQHEDWPDIYAVEEDAVGIAVSETLPQGSEAVEESTASDEIETEFLDIFMEEAREETEAAQVQFARWESNPHDADALGTLRRSFHTLKGSGRLVGALQVADFAQALEFLLNRLIETKTFPSEDLLACVSDAVTMLPDLVTAEGEGRPFEIEPMVTRATALKDGIGQAPAAPPPAAEPAAPSVRPEVTQDHDSLFVDDEELLSIFQAETEEHLAVIREFLGQVDSAGAKVGEPLQRALHTLTGSARMSGVDSIARVTKGMELLIKPILAAGRELDSSHLALLTRLVSGIEARVAELPESGEGAVALAELATELEQLPPAPVAETTPTPAELPAEAPQAPDVNEEIAEEAPRPIDSEIEETPAVAPIDEVLSSEPLDEPEIQTEPSEPTEEVAEPVQPEPAEPVQVQAPEPVPEAADAPAAPDPELASLFLEDARDLLDNLDTQFREWQLAPQDTGALDGINRLLHTLKGSARLTGLSVIGDLSHALETRLKAVSEGEGSCSDITLELAQNAVDTLVLQVDALEHGKPIPHAPTLVEALSRASDEEPAASDVALMRPAPAPEVSGEGATLAEVTRAATEILAEPAAGREGAAAAASPQIRVRSDLLNRLVNHAGEISIYRGRLTQRNGQLGFGLSELDQTVVRLREQLRQLEIETQTQILHRFERSGSASEYDEAFDPLEFDRFSRLQQLSGSLAETVNDLVSVKEMLGGYQREFTDMLNQQARLADDLQDGLLRTRLVPFVQVVPRLHRLVRQTADSLGKSARLEVIGPEVELDRTILDRLVAPLEHLLRNAVDHGLEDPKTRVANGKPATGMVTLALRREGNDAVISLSDDGKGMDLEAIRKQAISRGLMSAEASLPEEAMLQFILEPGFTTSGKVTQISGRGVGLDVVASEIKAANGAISLESSWGKGARFTIRLPLTLAIIDAFLVSAGENIYAVPHSTVEGAARISREELASIYHDETRGFSTRGHTYKVVYLGSVLEPGQEPELGERRWLPMLLARLGDQRVAFHVDTLIESQRILVKPLGPQLAGVRWLSGGTILPDGRVALILDALALLRSGALQEYHQATVADEPEQVGTCVMVVDDSLTVRRVTSRLLRRQNIEVLTAKDGVEALTLLDERVPDLILLDIEMPRMDGYELTRHIRRSDRLHTLPIIMITSRTGDKHRDYAMQLGVNRYLGKPYQESELLNEISSLLSDHPPL